MYFSQYSVYNGAEKLYIGNSMRLSICNIGSAIIQTSTSAYVYVHNVLHVTSITKNLISVSKLLADNNVFIEFHHNIYFVKAKST